MKNIIIFTLLLFCSIGSSVSREVYRLRDGWLFGNNLNSKDYFSNVSVPHSWISSSMSQAGQYTRDIIIDPKWADSKIYLRFNGVSSVANLFINSRFVGEHKGSHTAFTFDITSFVRPGQNTIMLTANNSSHNFIVPFENEYHTFGGIFRDVELIVVPRVHISLTRHGSDGVIIRQNSITDNLAKFSVDAELQGFSGDEVSVDISIYDQENIVASSSKTVKIGLDGIAEAIVDFEIESPRLWSGKSDPFMYKAEVSVNNDKGKKIDNVSVDFGLRYFSVDRKKGFFLNGKPYPLYGVTITQDRFGIGNAYLDYNTEEDFDHIIDIGATAIRTTAGPLNPYFYELCDKAGIVVWCDFPFSSDFEYNGRGFINSYPFISNAQDQFSEMLYQYNNHPSIVMYGIFNKISSKGDSPLLFIDKLNHTVHDFSPDRLTVGTSIEDGKINQITDLIGWGIYFGWRGNQVSDIKLWVNGFKNSWKEILPAVAEYGAEAFINHHYNAKNSYDKSSTLYPEEAQKQFHITYSSSISSSSDFWGYFVSSMYDYRSSFRNLDGDPVYRGMGLISYDRTTKKDVYYLYKALWNKTDKFVYISSQHSPYIISESNSVEIFSNCDQVELVVNGVSLGSQRPVFGVAKWEKLSLSESNIVVAIGDLQYEDSLNFKKIKTL